ncbi:hypothetical protein ACRAWD_16975 [Caulobacter segnis]
MIKLLELRRTYLHRGAAGPCSSKRQDVATEHDRGQEEARWSFAGALLPSRSGPRGRIVYK